MGTIWQKISGGSLRNKLAIGFTTVFLLLTGCSYYAIYELSAEYREEEFAQRLKDRTLTAYKLMVEVEQIDYNTLRLFDLNTINSLYEERVLLYDSSFKLIYKSTDDARISSAHDILLNLQANSAEVFRSDKYFETLGMKFSYNNATYYGITMAYDKFGRSKLDFLKWVLVITFVVGAFLLVLLAFYFARLITHPVTKLTAEIESISPGNLSARVHSPTARDEVGFLADKFNELLDRLERAFKFQYHFINHLSHEMKTPLAVMMSNTERALTDDDNESLRKSLKFQQHGLMELSHIMNAMLDISLTETRLATIQADNIRFDELLFECIDEMNMLYDNVQFDFAMDDTLDSSEKLTVKGNSRMLKMAILNLLKNAISYSDNEKPGIRLGAEDGYIALYIVNNGRLLNEEDQERLFHHLFRGSNSVHVKGFGLGLVLTQRIITLHHGSIVYMVTIDGKNCFFMKLPVIVQQ